MARKTRYYYDEKTCTFQEEKLTPRSLAKKVLINGLVAFALSCAIVATIFFVFDDPVKDRLQNQISQLHTSLLDLDKKNQHLTIKVDELHKRDNDLYRSMMGMEKMDQGIYEGGKGGSASNDLLSGPEVVQSAKKTVEKLENKIQHQERSYAEVMGVFSQNEQRMRHVPIIKPVSGRLISGFGMRKHPILKIRKKHTGIDLEARMGTDVYATGDGVVKFAGFKGNGYGIHIDVDHGYGFVTKYAHLSELKVKPGQKIKRGQVIGLSGNTGQSKGPHLHYEVIKNNVKINPIDHLIRDYTPTEFLKLKKEAQLENESMD